MTNILVVVLKVVICVLVAYLVIFKLLGVRVVRNDEFAIVERWWSSRKSADDSIISMDGETGYLPDVLRGGIHMRPGWMYKVHKYPLITIPQGQMGYVFARSGEVLPNTQLLGRIVPESNNFQDARGFLANGGQKGPQRGILREGTYAMNLAQFVVITSADIYYLPLSNSNEREMFQRMQSDLNSVEGFTPVVIENGDDDTDASSMHDLIGVVTVLDGPSLPNGEIIAPIVGDGKNDPNYHSNFQDPERFLAAGGYKGRQLQVLSEGSYMINRLFASIEYVPKTVIPVGYVGVIVSYTGSKGSDTTGVAYKHGELVANGCKGVWETPLTPGKYALNPYALDCKFVPTTNLILKWSSEEVGDHHLDQNLSEIDLITKDAFQPMLPLSVVLHIDYLQAPKVIQRFGDMEKLVNETLDPLISSYFKNIGQTKTLIELIQDRSDIQNAATEQMQDKFAKYNLELEEVLIGTPQASATDDKMNMVLDQLRQRQVAEEQTKTFLAQQKASEQEKSLNEAKAIAEQQSALTASQISIQVETNKGEAEAKKAEQDAKKIKTIAAANAEQMKLVAGAEAQKTRLFGEAEADKTRAIGEAEAAKTRAVGEAEATVVAKQVAAYGGPRYQLTQRLAAQIADAIKQTGSNLVPTTVVNMGGAGNGSNGSVDAGLVNAILSLLTTEKLGISLDADDAAAATPKDVPAEKPADAEAGMTK